MHSCAQVAGLKNYLSNPLLKATLFAPDGEPGRRTWHAAAAHADGCSSRRNLSTVPAASLARAHFFNPFFNPHVQMPRSSSCWAPMTLT